MSKILKFPKTKKRYSEDFLTGVKPDSIGDFIKEQNPQLSLRAADAMALAIIYSTYLQLVFEEEGSHFDLGLNDFDKYIWAAHDKKKLH